MRNKAILLVSLVVLILTALKVNAGPLPAQSLKNDSSIIRKLYALSQSADVVASRGSVKAKNLGCYVNDKTKVIFNSGYKDVDPRTQSEWAHALHQFITQNGGGWNNYRKYLTENKVGTNLQETLKDLGGRSDVDDPMVRAHVPYDKQAAFADSWWSKNSQAYKSAVVPPKDWWTNDAVLDGNNLWTVYEQTQGSGKGLADYSTWRDAELATLIQKK